MPQEEITGYRTMYPAAKGAVYIGGGDGRLMEHFHNESNGKAEFRLAGTMVSGVQISEPDCPRLHDTYHVIFVDGTSLKAVNLDTKAESTIKTFTGNVTIGQAEGNVLDHRYVPIYVASGGDAGVGVYDLSDDTYWTETITGGAPDHVQPNADGTAVVIRDGNRDVVKVEENGTKTTWGDHAQHSSIVKVGSEVWYVSLAFQWSASYLTNFGISNGDMYAIDIDSETLKWTLGTTAYDVNHMSGLGKYLAASIEPGNSQETDLVIYDLSADTTVVAQFGTGNVLGPNGEYATQLKPQLGENGKCYYGRGDDAWSVDVPNFSLGTGLVVPGNLNCPS